MYYVYSISQCSLCHFSRTSLLLTCILMSVDDRITTHWEIILLSVPHGSLNQENHCSSVSYQSWGWHFRHPNWFSSIHRQTLLITSDFITCCQSWNILYESTAEEIQHSRAQRFIATIDLVPAKYIIAENLCSVIYYLRRLWLINVARILAKNNIFSVVLFCNICKIFLSWPTNTHW